MKKTTIQGHEEFFLLINVVRFKYIARNKASNGGYEILWGFEHQKNV
jgi:hypothetical protein